MELLIELQLQCDLEEQQLEKTNVEPQNVHEPVLARGIGETQQLEQSKKPELEQKAPIKHEALEALEAFEATKQTIEQFDQHAALAAKMRGALRCQCVGLIYIFPIDLSVWKQLKPRPGQSRHTIGGHAMSGPQSCFPCIYVLCIYVFYCCSLTLQAGQVLFLLEVRLVLNSDLTLALFVHECYYLAGDEEKTPNDPDLPHETPGPVEKVCICIYVCISILLWFGFGLCW